MSTSNAGSARFSAWTLVWLLLAVGGSLAWLLVLQAGDHGRAWRSLLINFLFFSSLSGGLVVWPALVRTCNGTWHLTLERCAFAAIGFALPSLAALVLLWVGSVDWAPWYGVRLHQGAWLNNNLLFGRDLGATLLFWLVAFWYLRRRGTPAGRVLAPVLLLVYCLVFSLIGFDLVMALDPHWVSNLAGGYFFMSGLYIAITGWALLATREPEATPDQLHDLGKLIVAFSLMTTYLMFAHLLPFWYENLPHEVRFLVPRMNYRPWQSVSFFLVGLVYFGPLVLLLTTTAKRSRAALGAISAAVLIGLWIERWWLVAPTFDAGLRLGVSELSLAVGFLGMLGLCMQQHRRSGAQQTGEAP